MHSSQYVLAAWALAAGLNHFTIMANAEIMACMYNLAKFDTIRIWHCLQLDLSTEDVELTSLHLVMTYEGMSCDCLGAWSPMFLCRLVWFCSRCSDMHAAYQHSFSLCCWGLCQFLELTSSSHWGETHNPCLGNSCTMSLIAVLPLPHPFHPHKYGGLVGRLGSVVGTVPCGQYQGLWLPMGKLLQGTMDMWKWWCTDTRYHFYSRMLGMDGTSIGLNPAMVPWVCGQWGLYRYW